MYPRTVFFVVLTGFFILAGSALTLQAQPDSDEYTVDRSRVTGLVSFLSGPHRGPLPMPEGMSPNPQDPRQPLRIFGALFGITDPDRQLVLVKTEVDNLGLIHHTFQQVHNAIEVFTGVIKVHCDRDGWPLSINGDFYPLRDDLGIEIGIDSDELGLLVGLVLEIDEPKIDLEELLVCDTEWWGDRPSGVRLAHHVIARGADSLPEHILIDASNGQLLDRWPAFYEVINRQVHDANFTGNLPGPLSRSEGQSPTGITDVDGIYDYAGDFHRILNEGLGRDSIDGNGGVLRGTARWDGGICPNAIYNPSTNATAYCQGLATDDIIGHEFGHGLTSWTADLIYQNQSGQLNESYSDVFGELVDLWNGNCQAAGTPGSGWPVHPSGSGGDSPNTARTSCSGNGGSVRWLMGEDSSLGAIRDMWSPDCMGDPPSALHPLYLANACDPSYDGGGVHIGSGVPNHAFAMVTDGKSYNGYTVTGIGAIKSAAVWFRALTVYMTPATEFNQAYTALTQAAADLVGTTPNDPRTGAPSGSMFTAADATQIDNALQAVEMNAAGICNVGPPPANDECVNSIEVFAGLNDVSTMGATSSIDPFNDAQCGGTFLGNVSNDAWYHYTATASGTLTVSTCNLVTFDNDLVVYTGACGSMIQVACNGDGAGCGGFTSLISDFPVTSGTEYKIRIGAWSSARGTGQMQLILTPGGGGTPENCSNGTDDDGDGLTDCDDPDCAGDPNCQSTPENCSNGSDDDGDGLTDCDDPDCASDPACQATPENCSNGSDDDGDGLTDCEDPDCFADPSCIVAPAGDECSDAIAATIGSNALNTVGATNSTDLYNSAQCAGSSLGNMDSDIWYSYTATDNGLMTVSTCDTINFDSDLVIYEGTCDSMAQIACNGDGPGCGGFTSLVSDVPVVANASYLIRVGGWSGGSGTGTLEISVSVVTPEVCDNGVDDDGDGLIDCADSDCDLDPACQPTPCPAVENLICTTSLGTVEATWVNAGAYDSLQIRIDGTIVGILAGGSTSYAYSVAVGTHTLDVTPSCSGNSPSPVACTFDIAAPASFTFSVPDTSGEYSTATGEGSFTASLEIGEDPASPTYPTPTQGFSMALANDPALFSVASVTPAAALTELNGNSGPDFISTQIYAEGLAIGVVYDFLNVEELLFPGSVPVLTASYQTVPGAFAGASNAVVSYLTWSGSLGSPVVDNIVVVDGAASFASFSDGSVSMTPEVGGFNRGDCNVDASFNVADAVAILFFLFSNGSTTCEDACDSNDDGLLNVADGVYALAALFGGGSMPPAPHGGCGPDPTADSIECASYPVCD